MQNSDLISKEVAAPFTPAPHPRPLHSLLRPPVASQRGQGSGKHGTHKSTRSTFLSWEVSSNSLASLVTELPEDQSSDYKADRAREFEAWGFALTRENRVFPKSPSGADMS